MKTVIVAAHGSRQKKEYFWSLSRICDTDEKIQLMQTGLRQFSGGIDMGLTWADYGIADTGTLVMTSDSEETRLATMLCEVHVADTAEDGPGQINQYP